jgi:hypothetical protein
MSEVRENRLSYRYAVIQKSPSEVGIEQCSTLEVRFERGPTDQTSFKDLREIPSHLLDVCSLIVDPNRLEMDNGFYHPSLGMDRGWKKFRVFDWTPQRYPRVSGWMYVDELPNPRGEEGTTVFTTLECSVLCKKWYPTSLGVSVVFWSFEAYEAWHLSLTDMQKAQELRDYMLQRGTSRDENFSPHLRWIRQGLSFLHDELKRA